MIFLTFRNNQENSGNKEHILLINQYFTKIALIEYVRKPCFINDENTTQNTDYGLSYLF